MSPPQITAFTEHLTRLFQTLDEHEKMAAVTMHYLILYAVFERWSQVDVLKAAYENASVQPEDTYEPPKSNSAGIPFSHTYAAPAQPTAAALPGMSATQSAAENSPYCNGTVYCIGAWVIFLRRTSVF